MKAVLRDFAEGKVDVLIGTHRVLSRDVVAEGARPRRRRRGAALRRRAEGAPPPAPPRGGRARADGDADPADAAHVARGLRDISVIETPPQGRRPIRTHVGEYDEELVEVALRREHERDGQSFYLHNRVETIEEAAEHLRQLAPELRFLVAHGQLRERELEEHMLSFLAGDADVLVSTTIIESGLDIPQANTLIVERADALGLAQLYQIRGRVGRSDVTAHAYLFYPDGQELTPEARAGWPPSPTTRSSARASRSPCATSRSAAPGDLLGAEQSGHVAAIGFELYVELLGEAVAELAERGTRGAPGSRRGADRRLRPVGLHRRRGAEDRPPPPARARRVGGRAARAARGRRRPLRPLPRAGREPLRDPGGEAQARPSRRRLPRLTAGRRPSSARSCSARTSFASCADRRHGRLLERPAARSRCGVKGSVGRSAGRCYPRPAARRLGPLLRCSHREHSSSLCSLARDGARRCRLRGVGGDDETPVPDGRDRGRRRLSEIPKEELDRASSSRRKQLRGSAAGVPEGRDARVPERQEHARPQSSSSRPSGSRRPRWESR